jgi:hypothetical protein
VLINTFRVSVANSGTALPGVRSPWATLSGAGVNHALPLIPDAAAAMPCTRFVASRRIPATAPLSVIGELSTDTRKQYVHKTRVNAGGDGASGPHPEWEPA